MKYEKNVNNSRKGRLLKLIWKKIDFFFFYKLDLHSNLNADRLDDFESGTYVLGISGRFYTYNVCHFSQELGSKYCKRIKHFLIVFRVVKKAF